MENQFASFREKVVVTGGAGFIGSYIIEEFLNKGYRVKVLDDISTGSLGNLRPYGGSLYYELFTGSINDVDLLTHIIQDAKYVFHMAAFNSVERSIKNPQKAHEVNATGTLNVLNVSRECGVKKVVYASSSAIYGDSRSLPVTESQLPKPLTPYAATKLAGEYYCRIFNTVYGLPTVSLRLFNVYGPRQSAKSRYAAVVPKFISTVAKGQAPVIQGDGNQTRDLVFVQDVLRAMIMAAESDASGVFNICSGKETSINDLAGLVLDLMGSQGLEPVHEAARSGEITRSVGDFDLARQAFGYEPSFSLKEGLKATIDALG